METGSTRDEAAIYSSISVLKLLICQSSLKTLDWNLFKEIEQHLLSFVYKQKSLSESIRKQTLSTLVEIFLKLYPKSDDRRAELNKMFDKNDESFHWRDLRDLLMSNETKLLERDELSLLETLSFDGLNKSVFSSLTSEGLDIIKITDKIEMDDLKIFCSQMPSQSVNLKYASVVIGKLCSKVINKRELQDQAPFLASLNEYICFIFENSSLLLKAVEETIESLESKYEKQDEEMELRMRFLDLASKSSMIGSLLPTLITIQNQILKDDPTEGNVKLITNLIAQCSHLDYKFEKKKTGILPETSIDQQLDLVSPWTSPTIAETPHPVRDGFKSSETIQIQGAKRLVIYLDKRCATQNDYDKLVILNGLGKKIGEFGGNPFGQGNKRMLGSGWPKIPIVVEGNSVILNFEVKSRREAETMDKSVFGFRLQIGAIYVEKIQNSFSFFGQLSLSLVPMIRSMLNPMYEGTPKTEEESECKILLESKLLQRCKWRSTSTLEPNDLCPLFFPLEIMKKLKSLTCCKTPVLRSSLKSVICPEMLEEKILTVVIKHMGLSETVNNIGMWEQENSPEFFILSELVTEVYLKINSLIRRLQVLANLESQWKEEVSKMKIGDVELKEVFFQDYLHHESKTKELALLCFLKGVKIDEKSQEQKIMQQLKDIIEKEATLDDHKTEGGTTTESIVKGIFGRLDLLLRVDINSNCETDGKSEEAAMTRSLQCWPEVSGEFKSFRRQLSDVERSLDDSILQIPKLQSRLNIFKGRKFALDALRRELHDDASNRLNLLEQLFCFVGYRPEEAVSTKSFLKAVSTRRQRCEQRIETLKLMRIILKSAGSLSWAFVTPIAEILNKGLRTEELSCGNMVLETAQEFSQTIFQLVKIISKHPKASIASIGNLCVIPYKRSDEKCLLQSRLVRLLDELCDAQDFKSFGKSEDQNSISRLAWLGFKVLAQRCIAWEEELDGDDGEDKILTFAQKCDPLSLEKQISNLLANYLVKATQSGNVAIGNEVLQEVLVLLSALSKSRLGRGILSEPPCVSKLLQLLMEPMDLSPKVTMTIVKLAKVALPITTREACNQLSILPLSEDTNVESKIIDLLLTKLADYLIPESESFNKTISENVSTPDEIEEFSISVETQEPTPKPETSNKLSLFVHKRKDQVNKKSKHLLKSCRFKSYYTGKYYESHFVTFSYFFKDQKCLHCNELT